MIVIRVLSLKRHLLLKLFLVTIPPFTAIYLMYYIYATNPEFQRILRLPLPPRPSPYPGYIAALRSRADASGFIVLVMVDESFVDMAANLYEYSFRSHGIDNFLFVGVGDRACPLLTNMSLPCFTYTDDEKASVSSDFGSEDFIRKMNVRTNMIIDALGANLTVLHTDVDVAFIRNPIAEVKVLMEVAHIASMWDHDGYNAGFIVLRPTWLTQLVYEQMWDMTHLKPWMNDQKALNYVINELKTIYRNEPIRNRGFKTNSRWTGINMAHAIISLDKERFVCGIDYFEKPVSLKSPSSGAEWNPTDVCGSSSTRIRKFRPCADVVHNNWIVGKSAKIFRFREHFMWSYDPNGEYFANPGAKYLTYRASSVGDRTSLPNASVVGHERVEGVQRHDAIIEIQLAELKTALAFGHLLNRTVILPRFRCAVMYSLLSPRSSLAFDCPLNALLDVASFDRQFAGRYRESTFLKNGRVSGEVRYGLSAIQRCHTTNDTGATQNDDDKTNGNTTILKTGSEYRRLTSGDVMRRFGAFDDRVLVFDSFTDMECFPSFDDSSDGELFDMKLKRGFVRNDYRQLRLIAQARIQ